MVSRITFFGSHVITLYLFEIEIKFIYCYFTNHFHKYMNKKKVWTKHRQHFSLKARGSWKLLCSTTGFKDLVTFLCCVHILILSGFDMVHNVQIFHICHISQVFVAFPLQTFSTIFMEFLPLSFENYRNFLPVIIIWMYCVKAPYAPDRLLEFSFAVLNVLWQRFKKYTVLMSKKKKGLDRDTGNSFWSKSYFLP